MKDFKLIVVVPTFDNPTTIQDVINDVLNHKFDVIVVDDGSKKKVQNILKPNDKLHIITHIKNKGKGAAIISGATLAKQLGFTHILTMDADNQHRANQAKHLLNIIDKNSIIIGNRNFDIDHVPFGSRFGRWFSNFWASWDTGFDIQDSLSGYRLYPLSILQLHISSSRFDWEMEVLVRHSESGANIRQADISCYYPQAKHRVSHFRGFYDTMAIVWVHIRILPLKKIKRLFGAS
jgi:glycosyltransferase involved in cell wall biosynthesis